MLAVVFDAYDDTDRAGLDVSVSLTQDPKDCSGQCCRMGNVATEQAARSPIQSFIAVHQGRIVEQ